MFASASPGVLQISYCFEITKRPSRGHMTTVTVRFDFEAEPVSMVLAPNTRCADVADVLRQRFQEQLRGRHVDKCHSAGVDFSRCDRPVRDGATVFTQSWPVMNTKCMADYIKRMCTTSISVLKVVSTPHSGLAPRIILWHLTTFPHWPWDQVLALAFGQPGIRARACPHSSVAPVLFYHELYLEVLCACLNVFFPRRSFTPMGLLDSVTHIIPAKDAMRTTVMNVLFGDELAHAHQRVSVVAAFCMYVECVLANS